MDLLKRIVTVVAVGAVAVAAIAMLVSWYQMTPVERSAAYAMVARAAAWILLAGVLPWSTWFFTGAAVRRGTNAAGAVLIAAYTAVDALVLGWVAHWSAASTVALVILLFAGLAALAYNFLICDWLAERV